MTELLASFVALMGCPMRVIRYESALEEHDSMTFRQPTHKPIALGTLSLLALATLFLSGCIGDTGSSSISPAGEDTQVKPTGENTAAESSPPTSEDPDPTPPPSNPGAEAPPPMPRVEVHTQEGHHTLGVGAPVPEPIPPSVVVGISYNLAIPVRTGATALVVELVWRDATVPGQDLDLYVFHPDGKTTTIVEGGMPGNPDSPVRVQFDQPEPGDWGANGGPNGVTLQQEFDLYASVFYNTTPAQDYTAIPETGKT